MTRLGFNDINMVFANMVEALENVPSQSLEKNNINKIMQEAVARRTEIFVHEMRMNKIYLTTQAQNFLTYATKKTTTTCLIT